MTERSAVPEAPARSASKPTLSRVEREQRRKARDRRLQLGVVGVAVAVGLVAALSTAPRLLSTGADTPTPTTNAPVSKRAIQTVLWAHQTASGEVDVAAVIGIDRARRDTSIVFVPTATAVEVPSLDIQPIANVINLADVPAFTTVVANTLGIRIDRTVVMRDADVAAMFAKTPNITVDLLNAVSVEDGVVTLPEGVQTIGASTAARALLGVEADGPLAHFSTMQAIWEGWLTALRNDPVAARTLRGLPNGDVFSAVATETTSVQYDTLPVTNVAAAEFDRFEVRENELTTLMTARFGGALLGFEGTRPKIELLNGVGTPGLVQQVANLVVPAGGDVRLSGNAARFGERTTRVVYYRDRDRDAAQHLARVLGVGLVARGATSLTVVDITIVIGADFKKR